MLCLAFFFLLALAYDFRLDDRFLHRCRLGDRLLAHDGDRSDRRVRLGQYRDALLDLQVGDVQNVVDAKARNVGADGVGDEARSAADFHFAQELFEYAALFLRARRLAFEFEPHGYLDLLPLHEAAKVCVDESPLDRINLAVEKQNLARADAVNVEREDGVVTRAGAQYRGQLPERRGGGHRLAPSAVDGQRHHAARAQTPRVVLAAPRAQLRAHRYRLSLCHDDS